MATQCLSTDDLCLLTNNLSHYNEFSSPIKQKMGEIS